MITIDKYKRLVKYTLVFNNRSIWLADRLPLKERDEEPLLTHNTTYGRRRLPYKFAWFTIKLALVSNMIVNLNIF